MLEEWFSEIKGAVISKVQELIEQNETGEKDLDKFLEEDLDALRVAAVAQMLALDEESLKLKNIRDFSRNFWISKENFRASSE